MKHLLTFFTVFLLAASASAKPPNATTAIADSLFEQGRRSLAQGDLDTACERFRVSYNVDPAVGTRLNLADCEERRGRVASAWESFRAALEKLPAGDSRIQVAEARVKGLVVRLPKLVLSLEPGSPPDTLVTEGDVTFGADMLDVAVPMDPGAHTFTVSAKGRLSHTFGVTLVEGSTLTLLVSPGEAPKVLPAASLPPATKSSPWPWVTGGLGVTGLTVAAITGGLTLHDKSVTNAQCSDVKHTCTQAGQTAASSGRTLGPVSTVSLVVGVLGVGTGVTLLVLRPSQAVTVGVTGTGANAEVSW